MKQSRAFRVLSASPPLLVALLVARLWLSGTLGYYVNDRTAWIVICGALLFALVGIAAVRAAWLHASNTGLSWQTAIFLIPLAAGLLLPARPLSAASGQSSSLGALQLASHVSRGTPGDVFGSWIADLASHPDATWWAGQRVTLVGFVSHQVGLPVRSFIVGRYLVTCCVVDATLFGFPVQIDGAAIPAQGGWVQVRGVFGRRYWTDPSGQQYPLIEHAHLSRVTIPSSPYLSP